MFTDISFFCLLDQFYITVDNSVVTGKSPISFLDQLFVTVIIHWSVQSIPGPVFCYSDGAYSFDAHPSKFNVTTVSGAASYVH